MWAASFGLSSGSGLIWPIGSPELGFPSDSVLSIHLPMQERQAQSLGWEDPPRRKWQPTPVFLPGKSHGQRNLADYSPWHCKESNTT